MMTRSDLDVIRASVADAAHLPPGELAGLAEALLGELERSRMRETRLRLAYANLLAAARATVAAAVEDGGDGDPLVFLVHELDEHGQLPPAGQPARRVLADAEALRPVLEAA